MPHAGAFALVTGAASGIGYESTELFAIEGERDVVAQGGHAEVASIDVTMAMDVRALIEGGAVRRVPRDGLVNNARCGFAGTCPAPPEQQSRSESHHV